jgi:hypothetical protein
MWRVRKLQASGGLLLAAARAARARTNDLQSVRFRPASGARPHRGQQPSLHPASAAYPKTAERLGRKRIAVAFGLVGD